MNIGSVGMGYAAAAALGAAQSTKAPAETNETPAREASESRATQIAEGEAGGTIDTYA